MKHSDLPPIKGPYSGRDTADRVSQCEYDLEPYLVEMMRRSEIAGWETTEVAMAMTNFADFYILMKADHAKTAEDILRACLNIDRRKK